MNNNLFLASNSPRRAELLRQLGLAFSTVRADVDELAVNNESAEDFVFRMAQEKAQAGYSRLIASNAWVIGGDTLLSLDGQIIGKPSSKSDYMATLNSLSGHWHLVLSAVALLSHDKLVCALNKTHVKFKSLSQSEINDYWASGEPHGKAGGYAIQGLGAKYIERIEGSYSAVMGLPLFELNQLLTESGFYE